MDNFINFSSVARQALSFPYIGKMNYQFAKIKKFSQIFYKYTGKFVRLPRLTQIMIFAEKLPGAIA